MILEDKNKPKLTWTCLTKLLLVKYTIRDGAIVIDHMSIPNAFIKYVAAISQDLASRSPNVHPFIPATPPELLPFQFPTDTIT